MHGLRLVTTPATNSNPTARSGWFCNASDIPTDGIITTFFRVSRTALLAGATGLVGSHVLELLLADAHWSRVVTVGRRATSRQHDKLEQRVLDLGELETVSDLPPVDDVFCCLGTTIKQAGSQSAFRLVSAIGADPESRVFYSRVKGETETAIRTLPYRGIQIFRPSLLLGNRPEFRLGERIAMLGAPVMSALLFGRLRRYRPIQAATVARAMVTIVHEAPRGPNVFEYDAMRASTA